MEQTIQVSRYNKNDPPEATSNSIMWRTLCDLAAAWNVLPTTFAVALVCGFV